MTLFKLLFPKRFKQMEQLVVSNRELQGICLEQIDQIYELEDENAKLDFKLEDREIQLEHFK